MEQEAACADGTNNDTYSFEAPIVDTKRPQMNFIFKAPSAVGVYSVVSSGMIINNRVGEEFPKGAN